MVYMKKGATPSKNQQQFKKGKKPVQVQQEEDDNDIDDMDDSDDDIDSDEAPQLQRTPANKGIKGRQSLSEKKVSFSIPGKNSPAVKTPKKDSSILAKKQPTPANKGRTSMQEFKGIKGNKVQEEDDEDDDDEDDDFEIDEDMEGDDLDLDIDEGDEEQDDDDEEQDDDDEEDDDEDDDDEEDDDDDDEDDKDTIQKKLSLLKQNNGQNKQKTPVKQNDKAKNEESIVKGPKKEQSEKASPNPAKAQQQIMDEVERRRSRDSKMIYVGGLPNDTTAEELKSLSKEIIDVSLPLGDRKNKAKTVFAFMIFASEAKAESNYKTLQSKKFRGQPLTLDFVGHKSKNKKVANDTNIRLNLRKLFISGVPMEATIDQVAKYFKTAFQITMNQSPTFRTAVANFETDEAAKAAYDANKEITISGHKLTVLYSRQGGLSDSRKKNRGNKKKRALKNTVNHGENPAKKMKFSNKKESEE